MMAPLSGAFLLRVKGTSPVPGGRSIINVSILFHAVINSICCNILDTMGPRQIIGDSSSTKYDSDMVCRLWAMTGW